jgi:hypothetical protein
MNDQLAALGLASAIQGASRIAIRSSGCLKDIAIG